MFENILGAATGSRIEQAFQLCLSLGATCLAALVAVKIAMPLAANARVKPRKTWNVEPITVDDQSRGARSNREMHVESRTRY